MIDFREVGGGGVRGGGGGGRGARKKRKEKPWKRSAGREWMVGCGVGGRKGGGWVFSILMQL